MNRGDRNDPPESDAIESNEVARRALEAVAGNREALDEFVPRLYQELRGMAHRQLRGERADHTLGTTALVHEAYLKLARLDRLEWQNRSHFCAEAARAMRRILVDYAVRRGARKRGGDRVKVEMEDRFAITDAEAGQLLSLHRALEELESHHPRHARVVECRFFAGMTIPEIGEALDISPATVKRDWQMARAWLNRELAG
ncbi:MAG: ECF-type sigma factor [Gemmatimonadales bacterium]|jgi:RNA polymerase sigma factor (TIGR02999 family)